MAKTRTEVQNAHSLTDNSFQDPLVGTFRSNNLGFVGPYTKLFKSGIGNRRQGPTLFRGDLNGCWSGALKLSLRKIFTHLANNVFLHAHVISGFIKVKCSNLAISPDLKILIIWILFLDQPVGNPINVGYVIPVLINDKILI